MHYLRTLKVCEIDEDDYFSRLICEDITAIAKDIKESHRRDAETGDENNPLTDVIDVVKEFAMATDPMKATLSTLSKQLGMNFNKIQGDWGYPQQARQALSGHRHCLPLCAAISRGTACDIASRARDALLARYNHPAK